MKKPVLYFLMLWPLLFLLGMAFSSSSHVCCNFSSTRIYGWPVPLFALNKGTDSYSEAKRVYSEPGIVLLFSGWMPIPTFLLADDTPPPPRNPLTTLGWSALISLGTVYLLTSRKNRQAKHSAR